jgi:probable blue pigment (indigoidine) exporter
MNPALAAALAAAIWGTTYVTTDILPANPYFIAAVRALGAGLLLLAFCRQLPDRIWLVRSIILGTFNCGIFFALLFIGALRLPGGVAGTLQSLVPLFTVLLAWPLLGQSPSLVRVAGVVVGTVGTALLLTRGPVALDWIGVAAALGSAVSSAIGAVLVNRWRQPPSMAAFTSWQLLAAGAELTAVALVLGDVPDAVTSLNVLGFIYLVVAGTALAFGLWFYGIVHAGASRVAPLILFSPLVAFLMDALVRGIVPSSVQALGAALIMGSVVISQRVGRPRPAMAREEGSAA